MPDLATFRISHPTLGEIKVIKRTGSGKLSARWINGRLRVNIPAYATENEIVRAIEQHKADFEAIRPKPRYAVGQTIGCHNFTATIARGNPGQTTPAINLAAGASASDLRFIITLPDGRNPEEPELQQAISRCLHTAARHLAPHILLPEARRLAERFGLRVDKWEIAHGKSTLGTCFPTQRRIRLSYLCVFLDPELRNYIICHELAHLTEQGHTPSFHRLCDSYCNGRETVLLRRLRSFSWPVDR